MTVVHSTTHGHADPDAGGETCSPGVTCRDRCLRAEYFRDPFRTVKADENSKALALLPAVIRCAVMTAVADQTLCDLPFCAASKPNAGSGVSDRYNTVPLLSRLVSTFLKWQGAGRNR